MFEIATVKVQWTQATTGRSATSGKYVVTCGRHGSVAMYSVQQMADKAKHAGKLCRKYEQTGCCNFGSPSFGSYHRDDANKNKLRVVYYVYGRFV